MIKSADNGGSISVREYKRHRVKWISTVPGSDASGNCLSNSLHPMVNIYDPYKMKFFFNFHLMDYRKYSSLNTKVQSRANTGFAAIFDLLHHNTSKLYVTGFSFYLDNFIPGYKQGCTRDESEFSKQCYMSERHKQQPQWELLKNTYKNDDRIIVDPTLEKILSLEVFSRDMANECGLSN